MSLGCAKNQTQPLNGLRGQGKTCHTSRIASLWIPLLWARTKRFPGATFFWYAWFFYILNPQEVTPHIFQYKECSVIPKSFPKHLDLFKNRSTLLGLPAEGPQMLGRFGASKPWFWKPHLLGPRSGPWAGPTFDHSRGVLGTLTVHTWS